MILKRKIARLALVAVLALPAACGGDDTAEETTEEIESEPTPEETG